MRPSKKVTEREAGVAALEFALVLPILLMFILGIISIGHGMVVRYVLNSATYEAARTCAMNRTPDNICARTVVTNTVNESGGGNWCSTLDVNGTPAPDSNYPAVINYTVTADCAYRGIIATGYLASEGFAIFNISARAVMPY